MIKVLNCSFVGVFSVVLDIVRNCGCGGDSRNLDVVTVFKIVCDLCMSNSRIEKYSVTECDLC